MNTSASIRSAFPQFRNRHVYPDVMINMSIDDSVVDMGSDEERWGDAYDYAQRNLVAHKITVAMRQSAGDDSSIQKHASRSAGGVSVSYVSSPNTGVDPLESTSYGQEYIRLRSIYIGGFIVA